MNYTYFNIEKNPRQFKTLSLGENTISLRIEWNTRSKSWYVLAYIGDDLVMRNTKIIPNKEYRFDEDSGYYLPYVIVIFSRYNTYDWNDDFIFCLLDDLYYNQIEGYTLGGYILNRSFATSLSTHNKYVLRKEYNEYLFDLGFDDNGETPTINCDGAISSVRISEVIPESMTYDEYIAEKNDPELSHIFTLDGQVVPLSTVLETISFEPIFDPQPDDLIPAEMIPAGYKDPVVLGWGVTDFLLITSQTHRLQLEYSKPVPTKLFFWRNPTADGNRVCLSPFEQPIISCDGATNKSGCIDIEENFVGDLEIDGVKVLNNATLSELEQYFFNNDQVSNQLSSLGCGCSAYYRQVWIPYWIYNNGDTFYLPIALKPNGTPITQPFVIQGSTEQEILNEIIDNLSGQLNPHGLYCIYGLFASDSLYVGVTYHNATSDYSSTEFYILDEGNTFAEEQVVRGLHPYQCFVPT